MEQRSTPEFLCVGHLCHDRHGDRFVLGGTAAYAARTATFLGRRAAVLTSYGPDFQFADEVKGWGVEVGCVPASQTTVFENKYSGEERQQLLHALATPLRLQDLPESFAQAPVVLLGPIAGEVDFELLKAFPQSLVGVTPQGWLRRRRADGGVERASLRWERLRPADVVIFSEADTTDPRRAVDLLAGHVEAVVLTHGSRGATVFGAEGVWKLPAWPTRAVDPTGAGDVLATAFLLHYHQTRDLRTSLAWAQVLASVCVEQRGWMRWPELEELSRRFQLYSKAFLE